MVVSQIRSLYRDKNDLLRTVIKRVYEEYNNVLEQWKLKKIEFLFPDDDLPLHTDPRHPSRIDTVGSFRLSGNSSQKSGNMSVSRRAK